MKKIYVNLKRFDIPSTFGGVNRIANPAQWGEFIVKETQDALQKYKNDQVEFIMYLPEAHILPAVSVLKDNANLQIGSQSVYREDTAVGGNFGAFTTNRTANAMKSLGTTSTIIGHCEERNDKADMLNTANVKDEKAINLMLNKEIKAAKAAGLSVLYCIGEKEEEHDNWQCVLKNQLNEGLRDLEHENITIAYEPVWAIGPGKTPPGKAYIQKVATFIKEETDNLPVIYGGGLKEDNAEMLASIPEIDGGLIALTRFQGEIGFYPDEYLTIVQKYLGN
ncbi:Bifunctional PGK/TIM [Paraliobacillus sp. PM-2]|uniref:triose-phosphate isomerase family protein n=1 Tax=Paraliobacillus sp. PM-2 TaxID=1462524 RepID=UPI00061C2BAC|nr:triose-phosphate isomerase family protein [Paraliobacillus sp. PM-2]CQR47409.1 Bifunctional PGK/TIM [Paraliobacillus sp. PM-2]